MSALEELWLWLQGRTSTTDAGADAPNATRGKQLQAALPDAAAQDLRKDKADELQARVQRNSRYRAGPWQMK